MSMDTDARPIAYRPAEAARMLCISRSRLYELMADGTIPSARLGGTRLIRREALEDLLAAAEAGRLAPGAA